jgi:hypothetical protein
MQPGADDREGLFRVRIHHFTDFLDGGFAHLALDLAEIDARLGRLHDAQRRARYIGSDGAPAALTAPRGSSIDISQIEGQVRESSIRKVGEVVEAHPEEALAIIRTWLHQPV